MDITFATQRVGKLNAEGIRRQRVGTKQHKRIDSAVVAKSPNSAANRHTFQSSVPGLHPLSHPDFGRHSKQP